MRMSICLCPSLWSGTKMARSFFVVDTGTLPVFAHDFLYPTRFKRGGGGGRMHVTTNLSLPPPTSGFHTKPTILCVCQWCDLLVHCHRHVCLYCWDVSVRTTQKSKSESTECNDELSQYINRPHLTDHHWDLMTHNGYERKYNHRTNVSVIANTHKAVGCKWVAGLFWSSGRGQQC